MREEGDDGMLALYIAGRAATRRPERRPRSRRCTGRAATPSLPQPGNHGCSLCAIAERKGKESSIHLPTQTFLGVTLLVLSRRRSRFPPFGRSPLDSCSATTYHHCFATLQWMVVAGDKVAQLGLLLRAAAPVAGRK